MLKAAINARSHEGDLSEEVQLLSMSFFVAREEQGKKLHLKIHIRLFSIGRIVLYLLYKIKIKIAFP